MTKTQTQELATYRDELLALYDFAYKLGLAAQPQCKALKYVGKTPETTEAWQRRLDSIDVSQLDSDEITTYTFECLKLHTQKQIEAGQEAARQKAIEEANKPEDPLSPENIRRMVKEADRINAGIG